MEVIPRKGQIWVSKNPAESRYIALCFRVIGERAWWVQTTNSSGTYLYKKRKVAEENLIRCYIFTGLFSSAAKTMRRTTTS